ncbi:hypothetical protein GCM10023194_25040 [Planotetraspora phitsanulokensis]|uniref:Uncharacterized protein n=1 Tax=Planotetraspora phitsanulokensis TaxID=575192 RepID=A0A8J3UDM6_9ACTN|nr:hypothetical protein [Planotetraspora phitsanulokensis]GII43558.1 hypothetical protein Pph01_85610 [Planotetraspora phitsanulokensis]
MRYITRMGTLALSAAFLSIAAQSAASADVNPHAEKAMNRAAQFVPNEENEERDFTRQQNTRRSFTNFTALVGNAVIRPGNTGATSAYNAIPIQAAPFLPR